MRYVKALDFPKGLSTEEARKVHPGQYIRLFNSPRFSRWVGITPTGYLVALHSNRSGKLVQYFRHSINAAA